MNNASEKSQRKALGRGLSALLPPKNQTHSGAAAGVALATEHVDRFRNIPLDQIRPGSEQPRANFDTEKLQELADSIRANGVIQPISVFQEGPEKFRIIAGERRWRAAKLAGEKTIPALVRTADQHQRLELALIENLQREDLNPIEVANAFQKLIDEHKLSHEEIARRTGKDRSTVTNFLRLLRSSPFVRSSLEAGTISMGHARALLNLPAAVIQDELCRQILEVGYSVRQTENIVKQYAAAGGSSRARAVKEKEEPAEDPNVRAALAEMEAALGTRIRLTRKPNGGGRLEVDFYSPDDLDRIYSVIVKQ